MIRAAAFLAFALVAATALAQQPPPDKTLNLSVTLMEFNQLWAALDSQPHSYNLMSKLNQQALPQALPPPPPTKEPEKQPDPPPSKDD